MNLPQYYDGVRVYPAMKGFVTECCDCGLTHVWDFKIGHKGKRHWLSFKARVDHGATKRARRKR